MKINKTIFEKSITIAIDCKLTEVMATKVIVGKLYTQDKNAYKYKNFYVLCIGKVICE